MSYPLLENAPADHNSHEFLQYLRDNNPILWENRDWLVIENCKYGWPTAFAKNYTVEMQPLVERYGQYEWKVKPANKRTVGRFHIHILSAPEIISE